MINLAFIGCGYMAKMHASVALAQGHKIKAVLSTKRSKKIDIFSKTFHIPFKYYNFEDFLGDINQKELDVDAIVVCTPWNVTETIINKVLNTQLPVLVEKPVCLSESSLIKVMNNSNSKRMLVGYNRKFYDYIPALVDHLKTNPPYLVEILSAEPFDYIVRQNGKEIIPYLPHFYTSHLIDTIIFTMGIIEPEVIFHLKEKSGQSILAFLRSVKANVPITLKITMDSPQNSYIKFFFNNKVILLSPLEVMTVYDRLDQITYNEKRIYKPNEQEKIETCYDFKPGLFNQMKHFTSSYVNTVKESSQEQEELICLTRICDWLTKNKISQKDIQA